MKVGGFVLNAFYNLKIYQLIFCPNFQTDFSMVSMYCHLRTRFGREKLTLNYELNNHKK